MVMGQEERKNKAKLEKTQIQLASSSSEYEAAIKILEETTGRWNKEWKSACDVRIIGLLRVSLTDKIPEISRPGGREARFHQKQSLDIRKHCFYSLRQ